MIVNDQLTSLLVPTQLPEFIRDNPDYGNFVLFLKAYYEWMEKNGQVTDRSKNLVNYKDIDRTTDEFISYFTNDFLPNFPKDILIDEREAVKFARQLYKSKGTPSSYKFLFRILFNSDFDVFYTKDAVLKASAGTWYIPRSLKLASSDDNFLNITNLRLFGEETKSIATVETSVKSGTKTEVFISDIERLFQSGEFVRVVDNNNQTVLFGGQPLRAKIVGQISQIKIDTNNRGLLYEVGDPVIVYNGLNSNTSPSAIAEVGSTTTGSIQRINVVDGAFGYTLSSTINITNAPGASASVGTLNPNPNSTANIAIPTDTITLKRFIEIGNGNYNFSNTVVANANTTLAEALTFEIFDTHPISSVIVNNGGGGIRQIPQVIAQSNFTNDALGTSLISSLGILSPIQIASGGHGYQANDTIIFTGGNGVGAKANVITVDGNGAITNVAYVYGPTVQYPLGGLGYKSINLPTLTINSSNVQAANAQLYVPGILGEGASFSVIVDRAGSITTIKVTSGGEDYISAPNVSLKIQDIVVSNVSISNLPRKGDPIYQGANINVQTYIATVNSVSLLQANEDPALSLYNLRVFNYTSVPNTTLQLNIDRPLDNIHLTMANVAFSNVYNSNGIRTYGDGTAKAKASFLNGLVIGQGQYLTSQGHPSSFDVLQNDVFNNFTYQITVEKEIAKYRETLLNLLHPTGMKVLGRFAMKANNNFVFNGVEGLSQGHPLSFYTGYPGSSISMYSDFVNKSNNILHFEELAGANIAEFIFANSTIEVAPVNGPKIRSTIISLDYVANTVVLTDNSWLTFANVAYVQANSGSNVINIVSMTDSYDIVNNKQYSNTSYPLMDIAFVGDKVLIANNTSKTIKSIDYINGVITLTSNLSANANSLMAVNRTVSAQTSVTIYGPVGLQYVPELITENGFTLITEDGQIILLG
jgi:hypothetical protein